MNNDVCDVCTQARLFSVLCLMDHFVVAANDHQMGVTLSINCILVFSGVLAAENSV